MSKFIKWNVSFLGWCYTPITIPVYLFKMLLGEKMSYCRAVSGDEVKAESNGWEHK